MLRVAALVALLMVAFPLRAAAADIRQGNDIVIGANDTVDDDLYAFGNSIAINGTVNGDVVAAGQSLSVDGTVNGDVMFAGSSVSIRGQVASGAVIRGPTQHRAPEQGPVPTANGPLAIAIDWARGLVGLLLLGLFIVLIFPHFSRRAGEAFVRAPLMSLGLGVLVLIFVPILAALIFVLGALVGGCWLGLGVLAFYFTAIAVS